jgi:hypothetical protein
VSDNLVFYRINSWLWYWVFFLGTQLGDETYYSIFFSVWFWNIDGAVGRRVILVWCLVMYIGETWNIEGKTINMQTLLALLALANYHVFFRPGHERRDPVAASVDASRGAPRAEVDPGVRDAVDALHDWPGRARVHPLLHARQIPVSLLLVGVHRTHVDRARVHE